MTKQKFMETIKNIEFKNAAQSRSDNYSPIPLLQELASVYLIIHNAIRNFPKLEKFSIGVTIEKVLLKCIEECFSATSIPQSIEKFNAIVRASAKFDTLKLYLRLSIDLHCLTEETYIKLIPKLGKIGQMLGGWLKEGKKNFGELNSNS